MSQKALPIEEIVLTFHNCLDGVESECPGVLTGELLEEMTCAECGAKFAIRETKPAAGGAPPGKYTLQNLKEVDCPECGETTPINRPSALGKCNVLMVRCEHCDHNIIKPEMEAYVSIKNAGQ